MVSWHIWIQNYSQSESFPRNSPWTGEDAVVIERRVRVRPSFKFSGHLGMNFLSVSLCHVCLLSPPWILMGAPTPRTSCDRVKLRKPLWMWECRAIPSLWKILGSLTSKKNIIGLFDPSPGGDSIMVSPPGGESCHQLARWNYKTFRIWKNWQKDYLIQGWGEMFLRLNFVSPPTGKVTSRL